MSSSHQQFWVPGVFSHTALHRAQCWKIKFFVVRDNFLLYFKDEMSAKPEGVIVLEDAKVAIAPEYECCLEVATSLRRYHLRAASDAVRDLWVQELNRAAVLTIDSLYEVLELLGQGSFAKVKRGRNRATGVEYAIKIIGMPACLNCSTTPLPLSLSLSRHRCMRVFPLSQPQTNSP